MIPSAAGELTAAQKLAGTLTTQFTRELTRAVLTDAAPGLIFKSLHMTDCAFRPPKLAMWADCNIGL